jgi:hypothetical protein
MSKYMITAYDINHNELWISAGSSHDGAEPCIRTDRIADIITNFKILNTGKIINPETGLPVNRIRDPQTGKRNQGSRRIAYFRTYNQNSIWEIYITAHGRKAGIRNYQARRPSDMRTAQVIGCPPIKDEPRIIANGYGGFDLVIGEGDLQGLRAKGNRNIDRYGDPVVVIANCHRVTLSDTEGSWWGYTYQNYYTLDHCPLQNATSVDVRTLLMTEAKEMIEMYGSDITRW